MASAPFTLNQFLVYQIPLLVLNYVAGKPILVAFSVCRSFYGVVRQLAQLARLSVAPELTRLAGLNDLSRLARLFGMVEGVSLTIGLVGPTLALAAAPKVVPLWMRSAGPVSLPLFAVMMVTSVINVGKDTRLALLQATNRHIKAARLCLITYGVFAIGCAPAAYLWGSTGVALLWMAVEILQLGLIHLESLTVLPALSWWRPVTLCTLALLLMAPAAALGQFLAAGTWLTFGAGLYGGYNSLGCSDGLSVWAFRRLPAGELPLRCPKCLALRSRFTDLSLQRMRAISPDHPAPTSCWPCTRWESLAPCYLVYAFWAA